MNKRRTNRIVAVLNIISIVVYYLLFLFEKYIISSIMTGQGGNESIYDSFIIDTLVNNIKIILPLMFGGIGIINTICAFQNKKNKKVFFWQLVFGVCYIWQTLNLLISYTNIDEDILKMINRIVCGVVPIILVIINLILIKKFKPKLIQIISYIGVIILSILGLFEIISTYWEIIAGIMQLIYIHFQDKNVEESKAKKITNIILYYIIEFILATGFAFMVVASLLITKVNETKWKDGLTKIYNSIPYLQDATNGELYIPVENNYKYGFIDESGEEKIHCEYDRVSYFSEVNVNNKKYYVALAKKDNNFFIISKNNDFLSIESDLEVYLQKIFNHLNRTATESWKIDRIGQLQMFEFLFQVFSRPNERRVEQQTLDTNDKKINKITLTKKDSNYYYKNQNYSMMIEPIYGKSDNQGSYYDENTNTYFLTSNEEKYKVTITKSTQESKSSIVYLYGLDRDSLTLETYTNGSIGFENEDKTKIGWYDLNGNQTTMPNKYEVRDIKDDKIIIQDLNKDEIENYDENKKYESNFLIIDFQGKKLLQTTALDVYDNSYLVKKDSKKMVLMDKDLNEISNEYDKIITTPRMDVSANYSSYY